MLPARLPALVGDDVVRQQEAQAGPDDDRGERDEQGSSRNVACTICRRKPIARSTPICWRRSTTARALMTPSAATPTISPSPMKPSISRLNVRLERTASFMSLRTESACMPLARNADSIRLAAASALTPGRSANQWPVGATRPGNAAAALAWEVQIPAMSIGTVSASTPMTVRRTRRPVCGSRTSRGIGSNVLSSA